jgi:hypothetical protein
VIDVTTTASAKEQTVHAEPNASTKLTSGSVTGTGQWRVPAHGIAAVGTWQAAAETNFLIVEHHTRIQSTVKTEAFTDVKRIDEPAPAPAQPDAPAQADSAVAP